MNYVTECCICQEHNNNKYICQNPLIKNWYPDKINGCVHLLCQNCSHNWLSMCLLEGNDFNCPVCRFVYIPIDRLYHVFRLSYCIRERIRFAGSGAHN